MSLDKSRIPKRGNSSRKFIPEKQRKTMTDPFVDWIKRTRSDKKGTVSGYNQVLVMIDHFTKYAEAVPCITASAEETCDHLINTWIARHGCPMTFQSDNGTAFVGELTKELMRRSQVAQAHSTTYHPQTNGLVERQNRTLVSMLRVYCSRYMTDWDRYLPQVMGAYNSTQHSTTGVSPHMMLTGHEKSLPLTFFYPEYEGKKTSPQVYVRDVIRRQQELNDLCRRNTQQAQARQRKRFDKKDQVACNM